MRIAPAQLTAHLRKSLAPLYLVFGEETLLAQEAADAIRAAARQRGHSEREILNVEPGFDWHSLGRCAASSSLFATHRIIELRLGSAKPGDAGSKALIAYAAQPAADALLIISAGKLDAATQKSRWFTALEQVGVTVATPPLEAQQLPHWITQRLQQRGLQANAAAVAALCERVEGNLLAAAQEIDKLALLVGAASLTEASILAAVGDSARYNIYALVDAALLGEPLRVWRMLDGLRAEGVEPVLINWALHREVRILVALAFARQQRQAPEAIFSLYKVWEKRKPLLQKALQRSNLEQCCQLLHACAAIDRSIKGAGSGNVWDQLLDTALGVAGLRLLPDGRPHDMRSQL